MKVKLSTIAISFLLMMSGFFVVVSGEDTGVRVEEHESEPIEIHDWHDLDEVREGLDQNYVLVNDLDNSTNGYEETVLENTIREDTIEIDAGPRKTWDAKDSFDIHYPSEYILNITIVDEEDYIYYFNYNPDEGIITLLEDTNERRIDVIYELDDYTEGWKPIGGNIEDGELKPIEGTQNLEEHTFEGFFNAFVGSFNGNGHEIRDLYINRSFNENIGLFEDIGMDGEIFDIGIVNAEVNGRENVGGLVGNNNGLVKNSYTTGEISGDKSVGGVVGRNLGSINDSYANSDISGYRTLGGLAGVNQGLISNSFSSANVVSYEVELGSIGGLVGTNPGTIRNSYSTGDVIGTTWVGGIAGSNSGTIENTNSTGDVSGDERVGGLVGMNSGGSLVSNSYADGNVMGNERVGGLTGENRGRVNYSHATGEVTGDIRVAGLIGNNYYGTLSNSYTTSNVNGNSYLGGLVGYNHGIVNNSHYNIDEVLINGGNHLTIGGLFEEQFEDWKYNRELHITDYNDTLTVSENYYEISGVDGLYDLLGFADNDEYKFRLIDDIDLSNEKNLYIPYLAAGFDGAGHTVSNLNIDMPFASYLGMFGYLYNGTISNISVVNSDLDGNIHVGGLVGYNHMGEVSNSFTNCDVGGNSRVGGLMGRNWDGKISDSYATGSVTGYENLSYGGLNVGFGGLVGENSGSITHSFAASNVDGVSAVGGLVGHSREGKVENSFWDIKASGEYKSAGGIELTTDEMTGENAAEYMEGFDYDDVWETVLEDDEDVTENGYPILQAIDREDQLRAQSVYHEEEDDDGIPGFTMPLLAIAVVLALVVYYKKRW